MNYLKSIVNADWFNFIVLFSHLSWGDHFITAILFYFRVFPLYGILYSVSLHDFPFLICCIKMCGAFYYYKITFFFNLMVLKKYHTWSTDTFMRAKSVLWRKFNLITNGSCASLLICDMLVLILLNEFRLATTWS